MQNLANKYRPATFEDVVGQGSITQILQHQLSTETTKNAYLFVGSQGTGKTTCARIFAKEINKGQGNPIEMDAASNSGVEDVRNIIQQAQKKSLDSEYKVFIIDECHSISNTGWQAFLKLIEEPPAKSIFIFCTTNPEKIPKTILSRVQRFNFQRIGQQEIVDRLKTICDLEFENKSYQWHDDSFEYIAKLSNGGMRDAITMLDKCLDYNTQLTLENVITALGVADYDTLFTLYNAINDKDQAKVITTLDSTYMSGKDMKIFVRTFLDFVMDLQKYYILKNYDYIAIPSTYTIEPRDNMKLLNALLDLINNIKWDSSPMSIIELTLLGVME